MTDLKGLSCGEMRVGDFRTAHQGLGTAKQAAQRAGAYAAPDDARTRAAVDRLHRLLTAGVPLNRDAPRGYHLDISV